MRSLFTSCIGGKGVGDNEAVINSRRVPLATNRSQVSRVETTASYGDEKAALKVEVESVYDEDCETESVYYDREKKREPTTIARPIRLQKRAKLYQEEHVRVTINMKPRPSLTILDGLINFFSKKDQTPRSSTARPIGEEIDRQLRENERISRLPPDQQPRAREEEQKKREMIYAAMKT